MIRSTRPLPPRYRIEVRVTDVRFGGDFPANGLRGDETGDPWWRGPALDNGVYFLCITDVRPAPHNNVFLHHHRKVVMDTDNNGADGEPWSQVFDRGRGAPVVDGSRYVSMIWLNGETFGKDTIGNPFYSYTRGGFFEDAIFVDNYLEREHYDFAIERDDDGFTLEARGRFRRGGVTTYRAKHDARAHPVTWHYNRSADEYAPPDFDEIRRYGDRDMHTWPKGSAYEEWFFFGDPHINWYAGSAEFDDLKFYVPD
jgi:hypothetical protein